MSEQSEPKRLLKMSNDAYDRVKWLVQYLLPAMGTLYTSTALLWNLPFPDKIAATLFAVTTFLAVVLGISKKSYEQSGAAYDGVMLVEKDEEHNKETYTLELFDNPENLPRRANVAFKVMPASSATSQDLQGL